MSRFFIPILTAAFGLFLHAAVLPAQPVQDAHVEAELVSEADSIQPGRPFWTAIRLKMEPGWHVYWENPGDSGLAPSVEWRLPEGFRAEAIEWPFPKRLDSGSLTTYIYEGEVLLPVRITPPAALVPGTLQPLQAELQWLSCANECIPGEGTLALEMEVKNEEPRASAWAGALKAARARLPVQDPDWKIDVSADKKRFFLKFALPAEAEEGLTDALQFFASSPEPVQHSAPQRMKRHAAGYELQIRRSDIAPQVPARLEGVLVVTKGDGTQTAFRVSSPVRPRTRAESFSGLKHAALTFGFGLLIFSGILTAKRKIIRPKTGA